MIYKTFIKSIILLLLAQSAGVVFSKNQICEITIEKLGSNLPVDVANLIIVKANKNNIYKGNITLCEKNNNKWYQVLGYQIPVTLGENGIVKNENKLEGDLKTPAGLYSITQAFGFKPMLVKLDFKFITKDLKYIDDSDSPNYNKFVEGKTDAKNYENMLRSTYKKGIVIDYNQNPVVKGKGSAIFIHIWQGKNIPTHGCIAMSEKNLTKILRWLNKNNHPMIFISHDK